MPDIYDPWQSTFAFSNLSNSIGGVVLTESIAAGIPAGIAAAEAALTAQFVADLQKALTDPATQAKLGSDWRVVWGPAVTVATPKLKGIDFHARTASFTATNAAAVFRSDSLGRYIVAIAATNPTSNFDWIKEDAAVNTTVEWQHALGHWHGTHHSPLNRPNRNTPCISTGTFTGVSNLLGLTDPSTGKSLVQFLKEAPAAGSTLTFTGHSLAGALSPTLALACFDTENPMLAGSSWTANQAMVYPTAGATPGNHEFAQAFNAVPFGGTNGDQAWQKWNTMLWNTLDIVPHAWATQVIGFTPPSPHLQDIATNYDTYYPELDRIEISLLLKIAEGFSIAGALEAGPYADVRNSPLANGFYYEYAVDGATEIMTTEQAKAKGISIAGTAIPWPQQCLFQHVPAYSQMILQNPGPILPRS